MSGIAINALYDTCKQQVGTPGNIYELGQISCRSIEKYCGDEIPTVSKIQKIILKPAYNLLGIYNFQENLFKLWELPSFTQGLQTIKNTCDALPIFSSINLVESSTLKYIPYIKTPVSFIQSSCSLTSSLQAICSSPKTDQTKKLNTIQNLLNQLKTVNNILERGVGFDETSFYEACRNLERLIPEVDEYADSNQHQILGVLNRMILNSGEINKNLRASEIAKFKEIISQCLDKEHKLETLDNTLDAISDQFKTYLETYNNKSGTKSLLEVLKSVISWILNASSMLKLFFLGFGLPATALFSLEICSFIIRLSISFYKNYLINM